MKKVLITGGVLLFLASAFTLPLYAKERGRANYVTNRNSYNYDRLNDETEIETISSTEQSYEEYEAERKAYRKERVEDAVKRGRLSREEADQIITDIDNGEYYGMHHGRGRNRNNDEGYRSYGHCRDGY